MPRVPIRAAAKPDKPFSTAKAKATLSRLVKEGKVSPVGAKLIDIRELTPRERVQAEVLGQARRRTKTA